MIFEHSSYRTYLKAALAERTAQNSKYSLRALARDLSVSPAVLSQVMSSKRNFSAHMALQVAQALKMDSTESEYFCLLAQYESEKHPTLKSALHSRLEHMQLARKRRSNVPRDLNVEIFKLISDWYHIPIIEMTELKRFKFNAANIAKRLGIARNEAEVAIERLERLQLIEKKQDGGYRKTNADYEFSAPMMDEALNKFHKQMVHKAGDAIEKQPRAQRLIASNTFSIDPRLLPKAQVLMNKFRKELVDLFNTGDENTQTYHLGLQLFKLTDSETT